MKNEDREEETWGLEGGGKAEEENMWYHNGGNT